MNYILSAAVIGLALVIGYLVGRTAEAVRRERRDIGTLYNEMEMEARKRGEGYTPSGRGFCIQIPKDKLGGTRKKGGEDE